MEETSLPPDTGFVVDWQLSDERSALIDLSTAETEVILPDGTELLTSRGLPLT
jgi:hypothetical protein